MYLFFYEAAGIPGIGYTKDLCYGEGKKQNCHKSQQTLVATLSVFLKGFSSLLV